MFFSLTLVIRHSPDAIPISENRTIVPQPRELHLVFYEAGSQGATQDAVIIRYQEGSTSEADFNGELEVFAVLESVTNIDDVNII